MNSCMGWVRPACPDGGQLGPGWQEEPQEVGLLALPMIGVGEADQGLDQPGGEAMGGGDRGCHWASWSWQCTS